MPPILQQCTFHDCWLFTRTRLNFHHEPNEFILFQFFVLHATNILFALVFEWVGRFSAHNMYTLSLPPPEPLNR